MHIPSSLFTWDTVNKRVTAEASDLSGMVVPGESYIDVKHYPTGLVKSFVFNDNVWSGDEPDRELAGWEYKAVVDGSPWMLMVFND